MAINPYTLQNLYEQGILDYVPLDLAGGTPIVPMQMNTVNPYLQMAAQGGLYQNHGTQCDSFSHSSNYNASPTSSPVYGAYSGYGNMQYNGANNIGHATFNMFGFNGNGTHNNSNPFGMTNNNMGTMSVASPVGGYEGITNSLAEGIGETASLIDRTPKLIKNIAAAGIAILGIKYLFKRGKKPSITNSNTSFWSKFNPKNWKIFK